MKGEATEIITLTLAGVNVSGFVTPAELAKIEAGEVVEIVLRDVQVTHHDVSQTMPYGDVRCVFAGGEPIA